MVITRGNVLDDLGFEPAEAEALKVKAEVYAQVLKQARRFSQKELGTLLDEHQPHVSALLRGKITSISIEKLLTYAERLGMSAQVRLIASRRRRTGHAVPARLRRADATARRGG